MSVWQTISDDTYEGIAYRTQVMEVPDGMLVCVLHHDYTGTLRSSLTFVPQGKGLHGNITLWLDRIINTDKH